LKELGYGAWLAATDGIADWRREVADKVADPNCIGVIPIWSMSSTVNEIVVDEADEARKAGRQILGVILEGAEPPIGFRQTARVDLGSWDIPVASA
jgi:hypothetical protein